MLNLQATFPLAEKGMESSDNVEVDPKKLLNFTLESEDEECSDPLSTISKALFTNSRTQMYVSPSMVSG